ncbi:hypothetical protein N0V85_007193 [Neurospora sp. IMI 360204]|nr:hypothetical protein N0V85_007193 [Neurospora sp. IMI 360204]
MDVTYQLYSEWMRRVFAKERELQMKTAQLQQQAASLRIQAQTQEHLAINAMRVSVKGWNHRPT